jgi:hypothetical protein
MNVIAKKYTIEEIVIALILTAGVLNAFVQFIYNRSLWIDEAMLALNIIDRTYFELLKPLDYAQVAPILFLLIEKFFSTLLPNTEYGLRIFPFLCFLSAIYFFYKIIKRQFRNTYAIIIALSLFVFNAVFVYYSSEVKQYMADVAVLLAFFYLILKDYQQEKNRYYALGITGVISIFLSNVAPIILFTGGVYMLYNHFFSSKQYKIIPLFAVFATWLAAFSVDYYFFIHDHPTREYMIWYWSDRKAFLPYGSISDAFTFLNRERFLIFNSLSSKLYDHTLPSKILEFTLLFSFLTGVINLIRKRRTEILILTCTPLLLHLLLSAFQLYPFESRLLLYTYPGIIILCSSGFKLIIKKIASVLKIKKYPVLIVLFPVLFFLVVCPVKIKRQEIKESIKYIRENEFGNENKGGNIYMHYGGYLAFSYYEKIGFITPQPGFGYYAGHDIDEVYIRNLKKLHGKNWLLFSVHEPNEEESMIREIDSLYTQIKMFKTQGSSAYLYDFGE